MNTLLTGLIGQTVLLVGATALVSVLLTGIWWTKCYEGKVPRFTGMALVLAILFLFSVAFNWALTLMEAARD